MRGGAAVARPPRAPGGAGVNRRLAGVLALWVLGQGPLAFPAGAPAPEPARTGSAPQKERAYFLYSLAQQAQFDRNYSDALKYLEEAVHSDDCAELRVELADLYSSLNQNSQAEEQVRKALTENPSSVEARRLLAQLLAASAPEGSSKEERVQEAEKIYRGLLEEGKGDDDVALALADLQMDRKDEAAARTTLEAYRSARPGSAAVDLELARIYQIEGKGDEAIPLLRGVTERDKDNREAWNSLGNALEDTGRIEEARQVFAEMVQQNPGNPYAQYRLAGCLLSLKQYAEARDHLTTALRADPKNGRVLLALGRAYEGTNELKLAEGVYRKALEQDPSSLQARFFLAAILQGRGEDDEALALYGEIVSATSGQDATPQRSFFAVATAQIGLIRLGQKNYSAAVQSLGQALQASETPGEDLFALLARAHLEAGETAEAQKVLAQGLERNPGSIEIASVQGEILLRESKPDEARSRFQELLDASGGKEEAYLGIVRACMRAEKLQQAEPWMKEALERYPGSRDVLFQAGALDERLGHFREAERKFRVLLAKSPEDAETLNYLGYMLADRGVELEEARGFLEKAVSLEPDNAAFLDSLGWVHFRLGHLDQAESYLKQAVEAGRPEPDILEHLGDVYGALGRKDEALEAYRKALDRSPEKPEAIRKKIRRLEPKPGGS